MRSLIHIGTTALALSLFVQPCVFADTNHFEAGMTRFALKDYHGARYHWMSAASKNDPRAQFALGSLSQKGLGVEQSDTEAAKWWQRSANQGFAKALVNLGHFYRTGRGLQLDSKKAFALYKQAAEQGDAEGATNIASMYLEGTDHGPNYDAAMFWYKKAASQNEPIAERQLGNIYHTIKKDDKAAAKWWQRASDQNDAEAQYNLALLYIIGSGVPLDERKALNLIVRAAKQGHPEAIKWHNRFLEVNRSSKEK